jgi:hypothetical protein
MTNGRRNALEHIGDLLPQQVGAPPELIPVPEPVTAVYNDGQPAAPPEEIEESNRRQPCIFQLFVMLPQDSPLWFVFGKVVRSKVIPHPKAVKKWTYRGDTYCKSDPAEMLKKLIRQLYKWRSQYYYAQLEDTRIPREYPGRKILVWEYGSITHNGIDYYKNLLTNIDISWTYE